MKKILLYSFFCTAALGAFASGKSENAAGHNSGDSSEKIVIIDDRGKEIILDGPGERVGVFCMPLAESAIALSQDVSKIAGINPAAKDVIMEGVLPTYIPEIADIDTSFINRDFLPNVEELLVADPDVLIQWNSEQDKYYKPMEDLGIDVVLVGWGSAEKDAHRLLSLGAVFGKEERAREFLNWQDETAADIADRISDVPQDERTTMLFFDGIKDGKLAVFGKMNPYFVASGLRNLATENGLDSGTALIDVEQVAAWNPEVIFVNYYNYNENTGLDYFLNHPALQEVDAIKNNRIYETPLIDPGSHMQPVVCQWFATLAYPDQFTDMDVREKVKDSYAFAYDISLKEEDVDTLLQVEVNGKSALYAERMMR